MWKPKIIMAVLLMGCLTSLGLGQRIEITPLTGYGLGGEFEEGTSNETLDLSDNSLFGAAIDFTYRGDPDQQIELFVSRQETRLVGDNLASNTSRFDLDVDYYHLGGVLMWGDDLLKPFIVGTIGATHLNPGNSIHDSIIRPSLGLGGGVKFFPTRHIGFRAEARFMGTLGNADAAFISNANGLSVFVKGDMFYQVLFNAGVIIRF